MMGCYVEVVQSRDRHSGCEGVVVIFSCIAVAIGKQFFAACVRIFFINLFRVEPRNKQTIVTCYIPHKSEISFLLQILCSGDECVYKRWYIRFPYPHDL